MQQSFLGKFYFRKLCFFVTKFAVKVTIFADILEKARKIVYYTNIINKTGRKLHMRLMRNRVCSLLLSVSMALTPTVSAMAAEENATVAQSTAEESAKISETVETVEEEGESAAEYDAAYTGLANYSGNVWRYQVNGTVQWNYTGLVQYYGTWYYVEKGTLNWNYTGLTNYYGTWYYVENGRLNWGYTGLTNYYGTWYYVEKSVLNWNYTGHVEFLGHKYYVENGVMVRRENQFKLQDISAESDKFAITPMLIYYNQQVNDSYYPEYTEAVGWDGTATTWRFSLGVGLSNALWTSVDLTTGIATLWWDRLGYGRSNEGTVDFINKTATNGWDGFFKTPDKQIKTKGFLWEEFGITNQQQLIDMMKTGKGKASISAAISKQGRLGEVDYLGTTGKGRIVLALTDTSGTELGYAVVDPEYNYFIVYSMRCKFLAESRISQ